MACGAILRRLWAGSLCDSYILTGVSPSKTYGLQCQVRVGAKGSKTSKGRRASFNTIDAYLPSPRPGRADRGLHPVCDRSMPMLDLIMLTIGLAFFALSVAYAYACERL